MKWKHPIMVYYVYVYLDPRKSGIYNYNTIAFDYEPFYVGKGSGKRNLSHWYYALKSNNNPKNAKLKKFKKLKIAPIILKIKEFNNEKEAYDFEISLIEEIGSNFIETIKNGPLTNMILDGKPPSLKGKTYLEIYGSEDEASKQRNMRLQKQLSVGGFFKNHKHSEESKSKIGNKSKENQKNGGYRKGIKHSTTSLKRMKYSNNFTKAFNKRLYQILGKNGTIYLTSRIIRFCKYFNLSYSALKLTEHGRIIKFGKTHGWKILTSHALDDNMLYKMSRVIYVKENLKNQHHQCRF